MTDSESSTPEQRYGVSRIRKGFVHFLMGKVLTSVAGIGTMLLLVRELPLVDFAKYSILFGLVELVSAIAGLGVVHVLQRYVPEAHSNHLDGTTRRLIVGLTGIRFTVLLVVLWFLYQMSDQIGPWIGLQGWEWALQAYLLVVLIRICSTTLFTVLESLLQQGVAQLGFSSVTIVRFVALLTLALQASGLDLATVIVVEVMTDLMGLLIMAIGLYRVLPRSESRSPSGPGDGGWVRQNLGRMARFGAKGYAQHVLLVPFGGSTDRLLVGSRLATGSVAMFGFAQQILDLFDRYLPAQMFVGLIRPVLTARFASGNGFGELQSACNMFLKINLFLLGGAAVCVFAGSDDFMNALTGDKQFDGIVPLILLMCLLSSLYSWRHILDLVTHTVERNGPLVVAHGIMNLSVIPGFLLMPYWGVFALPASHVLGVVLGCAALLVGLARAGYRFRHDLRSIALLVLAMLGAMSLTWLLPADWHWLWRILACGAFYVVLTALLRPVTGAERKMVTGMINKRRAAGVAAATPAG